MSLQATLDDLRRMAVTRSLDRPWPYRFEAYTPISRRKLGYYALPLLWRDRVVGWANVSSGGGELQAECRYVQSRRPRDRGFAAALDAELERMRVFLSAR